MRNEPETLRDKFAGAFVSTHEPDNGFATIDETDIDRFFKSLIFIAEEYGAKEYVRGLRVGKEEELRARLADAKENEREHEHDYGEAGRFEGQIEHLKAQLKEAKDGA